MIDLHTHTLLSDGVLVPSELVRRAEVLGLSAIALTDHIDISNLELIVPQLVRFCDEFDAKTITPIAGGELTHVPLYQFSELTAKCRELGASVVLAHGETIVEPVAPGTNKAAIEAGVDILVHPGLISDEDAQLAAELGVALEITGRKGHSFTNGHVLAMARKHECQLVFSTDAHTPGDLMDSAMAQKVALGAGMNQDEIDAMFEYAENLVENLKAKSKEL